MQEWIIRVVIMAFCTSGGLLLGRWFRMKQKNENPKEQVGIAIGSVIGFITGLLTGFPLGVIWIAVGGLLGGSVSHIVNKHTK